MHAERIRNFRRSLQDRVAERRVDLPFGTGLFCDSLPDVYDVNFVRADREGPARELAAEAEAAMERFHHRKIVLEPEAAGAAAELAGMGWEWTSHVVMELTGEPDRRGDPSPVREVPAAAVAPARTELVLTEPWGSAALAAELSTARDLIAGVVPLRHFAVFDGDRLAGYCELREHRGVAQIEDVNTLPAFRGRGLGRTLVQAVADEARRRNEVVFLEALERDWPRQLYAKLGFTTIGELHLLLRRPHALTRLRLRTPRLELRLATVAELRALARVAQAGIHPPDEMPFGVPWTDRAHDPGFEDDFVRFHRAALDDWQPSDWHLRLVAFHEGRPIGAQDVVAEHFAERRVVATGSWLGRAWQGRGLGTEMRVAVLDFAFRSLGAEHARSGAIAGNEASLGVSRRLGYEEVGMSTRSPRGKPLAHHDLELAKEAFRPPFDVDVDGADDLRALFGAR